MKIFSSNMLSTYKQNILGFQTQEKIPVKSILLILNDFKTKHCFNKLNINIITNAREISSKTNTFPISNTVLEIGQVCKVIFSKRV